MTDPRLPASLARHVSFPLATTTDLPNSWLIAKSTAAPEEPEAGNLVAFGRLLPSGKEKASASTVQSTDLTLRRPINCCKNLLPCLL